jgi:hypothetical protein
MTSTRKTNALAVVVTGLTAFACSLLWYSPFLFGGIWMEHRGAAVVSTPAWKFLIAPLREIITSYLLAWMIARLGIEDWKKAAILGFWLWLAFYAVQLAGAVIWDDMPMALGAVHAGDWLMKMLLMSVMLSLWLGSSQRAARASRR